MKDIKIVRTKGSNMHGRTLLHEGSLLHENKINNMIE